MLVHRTLPNATVDPARQAAGRDEAWLAIALAHELSQPLAALALNAEAARELVARLPPPGDADAALGRTIADIAHDALRAADLVHGLRALFLGQPLVAHDVDLNGVIGAAAADTARLTTTCGVQMRLCLTAGLGDVCGHAILLRLALQNLIVNAVQAMSRSTGPRRLVVTSRSTREWLEVEVRDTGDGVPVAVRPHIFTPRVSTKPGNLGVGLSLARDIVHAHEGTLTLEDSSAGGTTFVVRLPRATERAGRVTPDQ